MTIIGAITAVGGAILMLFIPDDSPWMSYAFLSGWMQGAGIFLMLSRLP